jgi:hypothetical protein
MPGQAAPCQLHYPRHTARDLSAAGGRAGSLRQCHCRQRCPPASQPGDLLAETPAGGCAGSGTNAERLHPPLLQGVKLAVFEQPPPTEGAGEWLPDIPGRDCTIKRGEDGAIVQDHILSGRPGHDPVKPFATARAGENRAGGEDGVERCTPALLASQASPADSAGEPLNILDFFAGAQHQGYQSQGERM